VLGILHTNQIVHPSISPPCLLKKVSGYILDIALGAYGLAQDARIAEQDVWVPHILRN
jgi:hypothetical protein